MCPLTLATLRRDGLTSGAELVQGILGEEERWAHDGQLGGAGREIPGDDAVLPIAFTAFSVFIHRATQKDSRVEVIAREGDIAFVTGDEPVEESLDLIRVVGGPKPPLEAES